MPTSTLCDDHEWAGEGHCPGCEQAFGADWLSGGASSAHKVIMEGERTPSLPKKPDTTLKLSGMLLAGATLMIDSRILVSLTVDARRAAFEASIRKMQFFQEHFLHRKGQRYTTNEIQTMWVSWNKAYEQLSADLLGACASNELLSALHKQGLQLVRTVDGYTIEKAIAGEAQGG